MSRSKYNYCKVCGNLQTNFLWEDILNKIIFNTSSWNCDYCSSLVSPISKEVYKKYKKDWKTVNLDLYRKFIQDYVAMNPEFDEQKANARLNKIEEQEQRHEQQQAKRKQERDEASNKYWAERVAKEQAKHPKCPYCHSTHTHKISTAGRVVDTAIFGIASDTIGKNFQCDNCGTTF